MSCRSWGKTIGIRNTYTWRVLEELSPSCCKVVMVVFLFDSKLVVSAVIYYRVASTVPWVLASCTGLNAIVEERCVCIRKVSPKLFHCLHAKSKACAVHKYHALQYYFSNLEISNYYFC